MSHAWDKIVTPAKKEAKGGKKVSIYLIAAWGHP